MLWLYVHSPTCFHFRSIHQ
uniref:Uncharacterized protein n=1 Tax=Arundo donax TaxID=35708 RepID=A0A0A9CL95_ARUDO